MVIEFTRNVLGLYSADSEENDTECADAVIVKLMCILMNKKEQNEPELFGKNSSRQESRE